MHELSLRVYYEDTDAAGIVYHARYLCFAERGRTEFLRELGFDHIGLRREHDTVFAVHRCDMHFRKPAFLDDLLTVQTVAMRMSGVRIVFRQVISRDMDELCTVDIELAILSGSMRPRRLPASCREAFEKGVV